MSLHVVVLTARLELRLPDERDRSRFVELFTDDAFMVFAGGCDRSQANDRFDSMLATATDLAFAKQPIIERSSGVIVGYCGVDWFSLNGTRCLEFGYRLSSEARGKGYATEAARAVLELARASWPGTIYAMIDATNTASIRVITKLGFTFWRTEPVNQDRTDNFYRIEFA